MRCCVPLDWAMRFGNQGVALMHLADRRADGAMAAVARDQIAAALAEMRAGDHMAAAAYYEEHLPAAEALARWLGGNPNLTPVNDA